MQKFLPIKRNNYSVSNIKLNLDKISSIDDHSPLNYNSMFLTQNPTQQPSYRNNKSVDNLSKLDTQNVMNMKMGAKDINLKFNIKNAAEKFPSIQNSNLIQKIQMKMDPKLTNALPDLQSIESKSYIDIQPNGHQLNEQK